MFYDGFMMGIRPWAVAFLLAFCSWAGATSQAPQSPDPRPAAIPTQLPDGLTAADWRSLRAQIEAGKYHAQEDEDGGYVAANPAHGWQIRYSTDGATTLTPRDPDVKGYRLGLKLTGVGYARLQPLDQPQDVRAESATVTYQWTRQLREWWINTPTDLEQWFSLQQRPKGGAAGQWLRLRMRLDTDLEATPEGADLRFSNDSGTRINYTGLKVWDAEGKRLPARMHHSEQGLELLVDDQAATYPITIDPSLSQQAYLKASNTGADDRFGQAVAVSGDTVVVAALGEDSNATGVDGNQADNSASSAGAAYVFVRSGASWSQQAYLKASNAELGDRFGQSVAVDGDTVVVGAIGEDSNATGVNGAEADNSFVDAGAAYVFVRDGASWSQQAYLKASNTNLVDQFGHAVAVSGNTVVVGAYAEDSNATGVDGDQADNSFLGSGAAYVYARSGDSWTQQAYLKASNTNAADQFGLAVAVDGDTVLVGAFAEDSNATGVDGDQDDNSALSSGAVYVYVPSGASWTQQAYLKASNSDAADQFGYAVAVSGDTVVVGANQERSNATGADGDQADNSASSAGAAYVFVRDGASWSQQAYLKASNTDPSDLFGHAVAVSGDTVVVGAFGEDSNATGVDGDQADNSASSAGATYVFVRDGASWSQQAYLKASNTDPSDLFGHAVAVSGDTVVVGAFGENSNATGVDGDQADNSFVGSGAVHVFRVSRTVGGLVAGLDGSGLVLQNNGGDDLAILTDGSFAFATQLVDGSAYSVTVQAQPTGVSQTCSVSNASGTMMGADVTNVTVNCVTNTYTVGGSVSGLAGSGLVLQNSGGDSLPIAADGSFIFATPLADGSAYSVTVLTQPTGPNQTCAVSNASGTLMGTDVTNVAVNCVTNTYTVGGSVSGLAGSGLVLLNSGGDSLPIAADGSYTFVTALDDGSSYNVSVPAQPTGPSQICSVSNAGGTLMGANVTDIAVDCVTNTYTVGGSVSGLASSGLVLQNNAGDNQPIAGNGNFTFATPLTDGSTYNVSVQTQPIDLSQNCSVTNGSGSLMGSNVTTVEVSCLTAIADLAVSKTDGQRILVPGDPITYMITVTNLGPQDVVNANVQDSVGPNLNLATWNCLPGSNASCTASGTGDIDDLVSIASGSAVHYTLTSATSSSFVGIIVNSATVTPPTDISDPDMDNNTAVDQSATAALFMSSFEDPLLALKRWLEAILSE